MPEISPDDRSTIQLTSSASRPVDQPRSLNRREFVATAAVAACLCLLGCPLARADDASDSAIDVGAIHDFDKPGLYGDWIDSHHLVVIHHDKKIYACTSRCTHRFADVEVDGDGMTCPRHGSQFDAEGKVTQGPAKGSLLRFAVSRDSNDHLIIDRTKKFDDSQWDDPASFVKMDH
jgi:cytochrome b6-f complex iron-sulfur subunit